MGERLVVDPIACDGVGLCVHLAPELVRLDRWGFPIVREGELTDRAANRARAAVRACPHQALHLR